MHVTLLVRWHLSIASMRHSPVILKLLIRPSVKIAGSRWVVHHAQKLKLWKILKQRFNEDCEVAHSVLVEPQCVKIWTWIELGMRLEFIAVDDKGVKVW